MKSSTLWLWVFSLWLGCLPTKGNLDVADADLKVSGIALKDLRGAHWPLAAAPRMPRIELALAPIPEHPESRIWLLRGTIDDALRTDLWDPPLRQSSEERLVALTFERSEHSLGLLPMTRLVPGQRYTLAVLEAPEQLWVTDLTVSSSPAAGASLVESLPADQARGVPPNLRSVLLRFDGYLGREGIRATLSADGHALESETELTACRDLGLREGDCLTVRPSQRLPSNEAIALDLSGLEDATGAALDPVAITFQTGDADDQRPPSFVALPCAIDERELAFGGCALEQDHGVSLRLMSREPVLATLSLGHRSPSVLSVGSSIELSVSDLEDGVAYASSLRLTDLAGHMWSEPLSLSTARDLATISIDEVRGDPAGPEPAQESVELLNFGGEPTQIMGFFLSDDASKPGVQIVHELTVLPGERVLVVGPEFDPRDTADGVLSPGVRLARTDKALSISNEGEALYLRDARGRRVSAAPRMRPERPGACLARIADHPRTGAQLSFAQDPSAACTPGRKTSWP